MALRQRREQEHGTGDEDRVDKNAHDSGEREALLAPSLRGLEPLDTFLVKQQVEHFEAITGIETENSYQVLGANGTKPCLGPVLAKESSGFLARMVCGNRRPWTIRLGSPALIVIERPFKWLLQEVRVYANDNGALLGSVHRDCRGFPFQRNFSIRDAAGMPLLQITCPFLSFGWNFTLRDLDGLELGHISKKWAGVAQELFTDADNFGVNFPQKLSPKCKALVLGAVFLIDFCFFEDNEVQNKRGRRGGFR